MIDQIFKTLCLFALTGFLLSCGASKVPNSTSASSRSIPTIPGQNGTGSTVTYLAECNKVTSSAGLNTVFYLSTYYDMYSQYVSDKINFKFSQVPSNLMSDEKLYIKIYPWRIDANGSKQVSDNPLSFYYIQRGTGAINTPQAVSAISLNHVNSVISQYNLNNYGINADNFFTHHNLIIVGVDLQYDALLMVLYRDLDTGNDEVAGTIEGLIPAFYANPSKYREVNNYPALYNIHPLASYAGQYSDDKEYQLLADQICQGFFSAFKQTSSNTRLPASANEPTVVDSIKMYWNRFIQFMKSLF